MSEIESIYEEVASVIDKHTFFRLFDVATSRPHSFLWVDLVAKDERRRFRINFEQPVEIENEPDLADNA